MPSTISILSMQDWLYVGSKLVDATAICTSRYLGLVANSRNVCLAPGYSSTISSGFPQSKPFRPPLRGTFIPTVPSDEVGLVGSSGPSTGISGIPDSSCISGVHRQSSRSKIIIVGKSTLPQDADEPTLVPFIVVLNANRDEKPVIKGTIVRYNNYDRVLHYDTRRELCRWVERSMATPRPRTRRGDGSNYPSNTHGGLYDLDALDEALVTATRPSSSAYRDDLEPTLDNLKSLHGKSNATAKEMIRAAEADAANHAARVRDYKEVAAAKAGGGGRERLERRKRWDAKSDALKKEATTIVRLIDTPIEGTQVEVASERQARWQRALELYVYCPEADTGVDLLKLLDKLIEGCGEEEELLDALSQASQTCSTLVDQTNLAVSDAADVMVEAEDAYHIKLEAHTMLANKAADQAEKIEEQFRTNGSNALKIGLELEVAEAKKRQCDTASLLIRQWWMMESLAEQEELSGEALQVNEEVRGAIPSSSCRMDPLFTRSESSLEGAQALKALRTVVKSRGNSASGALVDPQHLKRFDMTSRLIQRTSLALESRLLESFSHVYAEGGNYNFSSPDAATRNGNLNWVELRNSAMALSYFDGGRGLHKRYVEMGKFNIFLLLYHIDKFMT